MRLSAGTSHWIRKEPELRNQGSLGSNLSPPLASCVTLDTSLNLSEVQFPIMREGDNVTHCCILHSEHKLAGKESEKRTFLAGTVAHAKGLR